mmetsp:Transcript_38883/g.57817  ORF Transcript_38883/g.57817 Transcript_38883/m.57817 type:complete len:88 (-) Transcript_38883:922-1185(-)
MVNVSNLAHDLRTAAICDLNKTSVAYEGNCFGPPVDHEWATSPEHILERMSLWAQHFSTLFCRSSWKHFVDIARSWKFTVRHNILFG